MTNLISQGRAALHSAVFTVFYFATLCAAVSAGPPRYTVVRLGAAYGALNLDGDFMRPWRLNNDGDVIGDSNLGYFLLRGGRTVHYLGSPNVPMYGALREINDRGVILGNGYDWSFQGQHGFFSYALRSSGPQRDLNVEKARRLPFQGFIASGINNRGVIVGDIIEADGRRKAVIYEQGQLRELPGGGSAYKINNRNQVIGSRDYRPVLWSNGHLQELTLPPGYDNGYCMAINDHGVAVGWCHNPQPTTGFIYRDGVVRLLPRPAGPHTFAPLEINNAGDVLFFSQSDTLGITYFLYTRGRLYDLTPIIARDAGWPVAGFELLDMNDHGAMVGIATYLGRGGWRNQGILLIPKQYPPGLRLRIRP